MADANLKAFDDAHAYLLHVLTELPQRAPDADISDLLPFNFTRQKTVTG